MMDLIWPSRDAVTIDIPLEPANFSFTDATAVNKTPIEFMICRKRDFKTKFNDMPYLKNFVSLTPATNLRPDVSQLIVLSELDEVVNHLVDGQVGDILEKMGEKNVNYIHITD